MTSLSEKADRVHNEYTSVLSLFKVVSFNATNKIATWKNSIGQLTRLSSRLILTLLTYLFNVVRNDIFRQIVIFCHIRHLYARLELLFATETTSQVSVVGFKLPVVRLGEVSVLKAEFHYSKLTEKRQGPTQGVFSTVEPRFNKPPFNENLDITKSILCPSDSKIYEKEPRYRTLDLTNEFGWSPATSLNRGSTV